MKNISDKYLSILRPERLWSRSEMLSRPSPVPAQGGVYAWYFTAIPGDVPVEGCVRWQGGTLLYAGISPGSPRQGAGRPSSQTLHSRLRDHLVGNAEGSTLRLSLGCLLSEALGIELRRVGGGRRMTFGRGEDLLSAWLADYAFVSWFVTPTPWIVEEELMAAISLPLNLDKNQRHPFYRALSDMRSMAKAKARELPIVPGV